MRSLKSAGVERGSPVAYSYNFKIELVSASIASSYNSGAPTAKLYHQSTSTKKHVL